MRISRLVVLGFSLLFLPIPGVAADTPPKWAHELSDIPVSPRVTFGQLENGFRYALVPNHTPSGQVSIRLLVLAGSLNEREDELGYAHFVEHMAFRSTRNFPADQKVKFLQSLGVGFGPHVNAETSSRHTLYKLDLPENSSATVEGAFKILRDWADGLVFNQEEIDRERGVVLSEAASMHRSNGQFEALYAGTLVVRRPPIGTDVSIKKAKASGLRGFYDAWYRPENMVAVVVGDFDPAMFPSLLKNAFDSLQARGQPRPAPPMGVLTDAAKPMAQFFPEIRNGVQTELGTIRIEPSPADTKKARFNALELETAHRMLRRRLQRLVNDAEAPITGFVVNDGYPFGEFRQLSIITAGNAHIWPTVLGTGEQELRRALELGFDVKELRGVQEAFRVELTQDTASATTTPTSALANELAAQIETGRIFTFPDERLAQVLASIDRLTVEGCQQALQQAWGESPRYVFITASPRLIKTTPEQIRAKLRESQTEKVNPVTVLEKPKFAYEDFGPPGEVVGREHIVDLDVWQVRFANGVRLNLKKNDFEHDHVRIGVRVGSGRFGEPKDKPGIAAMAGLATLFGGLKKHSDDEFQRAMNGSHITMNFDSQADTFAMTASSSASEFTMALRVLTAFLTDAAFRPSGNPQLIGNFNDLYNNLGMSADGVIAQKVASTLSGEDPRLGFPPRKIVEQYTVASMGEWLRPIFKTDPVEVTLIGDFETERAIEEIARTLGTIALRKQPGEPGGETKLRFPNPPFQKTYGYRTPDKNRPVTLAFYWPVNESFTHADNSRLQLLGLVLQERLRVEVRVDKGETYSPSANFEWSEVYPGLANLHCRVDVKSDRVRKIGDLMKNLALKISREGVTADELARVRAVAIADVRRFKQNNDYWFSVLSDSQQHPWRLENARSIEQDYASATAGEISALAAKFLTEKNLCQFTIKPEYQKP